MLYQIELVKWFKAENCCGQRYKRACWKPFDGWCSHWFTHWRNLFIISGGFEAHTKWFNFEANPCGSRSYNRIGTYGLRFWLLFFVTYTLFATALSCTIYFCDFFLSPRQQICVLFALLCYKRLIQVGSADFLGQPSTYYSIWFYFKI